jgi:hypothetical protein
MGLSSTRITADRNVIAMFLLFAALKPPNEAVMHPLLLRG